MGKVIATGHYCATGLRGINHHDFVMRRHVLVIHEDGDSGGREIADHARLDSVGLLGVGDDDDLDPPALGADERVGDVAMGEAEGLHKDLFPGVGDRASHEIIRFVARSKGDGNFSHSR